MSKNILISIAFSLALLPGLAFANDATSSSPPGVTMSASGGVPTPPVCNTSTQKLHWNGSGWQCLALGHATSAGSVSGYAKGGIAGDLRATGYNGARPCPGGFYPVTIEQGSAFGGTWINGKYICVKS